MTPPSNVILNTDCIEGMRSLPDGFCNLIIADPPYNLGKDFGAWKEVERKSEWKEWTRAWLAEALRLLSMRGNIFVYGIHHHQCWCKCMMYELGFSYRRQIIWHYENGFGGYSRRSLNAYYEFILWFSRTERYIYHPVREPYKSQERLKHRITMKNGKAWKPIHGRMAGDIWYFPTLCGTTVRTREVEHPTQKPLSISRRMVRHFSDFLGRQYPCALCWERQRMCGGRHAGPAIYWF